LGDREKPLDTLAFLIVESTTQQPAQFLKLGDKLATTGLMVDQFAYKKVRHPDTGKETDVSEVTLLNKATGKSVVLVMNQPTDLSAVMTPPRTPAPATPEATK